MGYILRILYDTVEEATRFQDQTINLFFQNSKKVGVFLRIGTVIVPVRGVWHGKLFVYSKMEKYFSPKIKKKNGNDPKCLKAKHCYDADRTGIQKTPLLLFFLCIFYYALGKH